MVLITKVRLVLVAGMLLLSGNTLLGEKLAVLIAKADSLQNVKSDSILPVLHHCLGEIDQGTPSECIKVFNLVSHHFLKREEMDSALIYTLLRLDLAKEYDMSYHIIMAKTDLGEIFIEKGKYQKAINYLSEARELGKTTQSLKVQAKIASNQAYLYYLFHKRQESVSLLKEALSLYEEMCDTMNMAYVNNNLGILYKNMSQPDSAMIYLNQSYLQSIIVKDTLGMASACNNMGSIMTILNDLKAGVYLLEKSLYYYQQLGREEVTLYGNIGRIYAQMKQFDKSAEYLNKALIMSSENGNPVEKQKTLSDLSELYRDQENWEQAYKYMNMYHELKDKEYDQKLPELIDRIQAEADLKVKEKTIDLLKEKNNFQALYIHNRNMVIILLVVIVLVGVVLGFSIYSRKRDESKRRELIMEQRLLRSQMNPHFFFNTLSIIQSFVIRNEAKLAGKYIAKFARLMREILENSAKNKITLQKELAAMENYLSLQQLRMNDNFEYQVRVDQNINTLAIEIPPMLFQPFIENAIDHGLNHLTEQKGMLDIHVSGYDNLLKVIIRDNGVGRKKSAELNGSMRSSHQSMGMKITEERLHLLANDQKKRSQLIVQDLVDDNKQAIGTEVEVQIAIG